MGGFTTLLFFIGNFYVVIICTLRLSQNIFQEFWDSLSGLFLGRPHSTENFVEKLVYLFSRNILEAKNFPKNFPKIFQEFRGLKKLVETKKELFNLRFQQATGNLEKPSRLRELRHTVARMKTVLKEREAANESAAE